MDEESTYHDAEQDVSEAGSAPDNNGEIDQPVPPYAAAAAAMPEQDEWHQPPPNDEEIPENEQKPPPLFAGAAAPPAAEQMSELHHQRSLRQFSMPRSEQLPHHRLHHHHHASSNNHQSQLRRQAHAARAPPLRSPSDSARRSNSLGNLANAAAAAAGAVPGAPAVAIAPPVAAVEEEQAPPRFAAIEMPRANLPPRAASVPSVASSSASRLESQSDHVTNSGWSIVRTTSTGGGAPPCERSLHTAAMLNGNMLVFGGYSGHSRCNDFHSYSFAEKRWSPVLPAATSGRPPSPRDRHVSVTHGNSFYVQGGFDGTSRVSDFFAFDFSSMIWREIVPSSGRPPTARHSHAAIVWRNSMFIYGGYDGSYKTDLHEFEFNLSRWSAVPAAGRRPRARYRATCVVHKSSMILFGGHDGTRHLQDTHVFDLETRIWSSLVTEGPPPIPRDSHVSVVFMNSMYVFGGSSGSAMNDLHELQMPSDAASPAKWRAIKFSGGTEPSHRFCHVAVVHGDAMYVFGGYDGSERLNDFIRFDFAVYDLSFEVPESTLIQDLRLMVNDETFSDIIFVVQGQQVYAHKVMLMRSSYFRALFLGPMRESQQASIDIEHVSHPIFLSVLEYLYTDQIDIPLKNAMELFEAADLFCIPRLKTMCEKRMLQSITIENAASIFHAADLHTATALRQKALKYILSHFEDVSKTKSFEEMGRNNMELVFEVLRNR